MAGDESNGGGETAGRRGLWICLLVLPFLLHAVAFAATLRGRVVGVVDAAVYLATCGYLLAVWRWSVKLPDRLPHATLLVYVSLVCLGVGEWTVRLLTDPPLERAPRQPGVRRSRAAETLPGLSGEIVFTVNRLGLRGSLDRFETARRRLLCVGGSTTECLYVTDEASWPWRLEALLNAGGGEPVCVANAGMSGHLARHHAYLIRNYPLADRFDSIVVLCGVNDLGALLRRNYEDRVQAIPAETLSPLRERGIYYRRSRLLELAVGRWQAPWADGVRAVVQDAEGRWIDEQRRQRREKLRAGALRKPPPGLAVALERYRIDLRDVVAACRERQAEPILATQPTLYRSDLPARLADLLWIHCDDGAYDVATLAEMMERYNEVLREVAREERVRCVDLARRLPCDDRVFYDDCHFNIGGCDLVARRMAEALREPSHAAAPSLESSSRGAASRE